MQKGFVTSVVWAAVGVLAILSAGSTPAAELFESPVAVTHVTIHPGEGPTIEDGVILIEKGRITAVGASLTVPPYADVIDATGMVAYPGFISAHGYLGISEDERTEEERIRLEDENPDPKERALVRTRWANRRGINPQYRAAEHYHAADDALDPFRKIGITTMLVAPRYGIFGGTSDVVNLVNKPLRRVILAADVAQHASFEVGEPGRYPRSLLGVFAQFRQVLLDTGYAIEQEKYFQRHPQKTLPPPVDPALQALRPVLNGDRPVIFLANTEHEINRALNLAQEFDLKIIISGAKEAYKVIDRLKAQNVPLIVSLKFEEEPEYGKKETKKVAGEKEKTGPEKTGEGDKVSDQTGGEQDKDKAEKNKKEKKRIYEPLKLRKERRRIWEEHAANIIKLHEAGLAFSLSTREFKKPSELIENLRLVIDRGLPVEAALAALTRAPASLLGLSDQLGLIEPGYLANIVIMTQPLESEKSKVKYVLVEGEKTEFDRDEKKEKKDNDNEGEGQNDKPNAGDSQPQHSEVADSGKKEKEDQGPTWRCEIEADRVPKTVTGGNVLVDHATVITVSGPTLEETSILIQKGKITAIGRDLTVPADTTVIDATGRYVIPGMIDPHSHMAISSVNEGTMAVSAEVRIADLVVNDSVAIYRALAGGVTTTHAMHGSANPIGGQNVIFKLKYKHPVQEMIMHDAPRTIKFALGENVKQSNFFMAYGKRFPNGRMGVEAVIRDAFTAGRQYMRAWDKYKADVAAGLDVLPPRRDLRLDAIADILRGDLWIHSHCYRSDEILRLMKVAEDYGVRIAVLQHVLEGYRVAAEIARHGAGASTFSNFWAYKVEAYGAIPYNAALMTAHGIVTSVNSDSANTIRRMNVEAAKCIKWGSLSENQALRLVTLNPAIQLGIDDRVGSIEVGKDGDLAIFNGHPLNSFAKNVMTLIEGEVYFEDDHPDPVVPAGPLDWNKKADTTVPESPHRLYAIVGGTVHPISSEPIENGTVLIRNDRIVAVGTDVEIPPGAGIVHAQGLHVYPGLIDGGGNLGLIEIGAVRSTRDNFDIATYAPELRASSAVNPHSEHIRIAHSGGITSQLVKPAGSTISGQSAVIHLDGWTLDEMLVKDGVGLHVSVPSLPIHLRGEDKDKKKRKKEHKKAMHDLEDFVARAKRYAAAKKAAGSDPTLATKIDLRLEAMIPYVEGQKPVIFRASSYKAILDAIDFAEKQGLKAIISGGAEAWKLADLLAEKDIPVISGTVVSYPRGKFEAWDAVYACASVLDKAGVRWCFASQSASSAYDLGSMAGLAVAHGLDPERAMYALTLGAAKVLGIDKELGSLEVGKIADVIVTNLPPTQTVAKVTHMFIKGKPISLTSMHTENYDKFKNRPEPNLPPEKQLVGPPSLTGR